MFTNSSSIVAAKNKFSCLILGVRREALYPAAELSLGTNLNSRSMLHIHGVSEFATGERNLSSTFFLFIVGHLAGGLFLDAPRHRETFE